MRSTAWKEIAELGGIAAIIVGLILVYVEIQQNSVIARASLISEGTDYEERIYDKLADPNFAALYSKSQTSPADLTAAERVQLDAFLESVLSLIGRHNLMYFFGVVEIKDFYADLLAPKFFGSGYGEIWWNAKKMSVDAYPGFKLLIDDAVSRAKESNEILKFNQSIADQISNL